MQAIKSFVFTLSTLLLLPTSNIQLSIRSLPPFLSPSLSLSLSQSHLHTSTRKQASCTCFSQSQLHWRTHTHTHAQTCRSGSPGNTQLLVRSRVDHADNNADRTDTRETLLEISLHGCCFCTVSCRDNANGGEKQMFVL